MNTGRPNFASMNDAIMHKLNRDKEMEKNIPIKGKKQMNNPVPEIQKDPNTVDLKYIIDKKPSDKIVREYFRELLNHYNNSMADLF